MADARTVLNSALDGSYRLGDTLGQGGMATVYLADDLRHGRKVAVKVLEERATMSAPDARFRREIETAARLNHPHILSLHDSGEAEGLHYYVMPYVEGETLRDRLNREGRLSPSEAIRLCAEIAEALDYAHRVGIVHRDIKPENIMLHEGHAAVADFGIAAVGANAEASGLTATGTVIGTPAYLSPEQVNGGPLDGRSDLYSLACLLFECLTGSVPFSGSAVAMIAQRVMGEVPSVCTVRSDLPTALDRVVQRAMAVSPAERYQTGADLMAALRDPGAGRPESGRPSIVVLPFANMSPDPENEYFSDGLTDEVITDLSSVKGLSVISRTSAMRLKGTDKDVRTIGRELGVRYVLEGGVRKAGDRLRITAQLVDAAKDEPVWSERFNGTMDEVFEVQERVAREIVRALDVTLTSDEDRSLGDRPVRNVKAYELYLQAKAEFRRYGPGTERGMKLLAHAREIEGDTIPLRLLEATGKVELVRAGMAADHSGLDEAEEVARQALAEDPERAYARATGILGFVAYERGDMLEAVRRFNESLETDPSDVDVLFFLSVTYSGAGQTEAALATAKRLVEADPLSPMAWISSTVNRWFVGQAAEGLPMAHRALELDASHTIARWVLAYTQAVVGQHAEAGRHARILLETAPEMIYTPQICGLVAALEGRPDEALGHVEGVAGLDGHHMFHLAEVYAMAGEHTRAMDLVEAGLSWFHPHEFIRTHCPFLEPLRGAARFQKLADEADRKSEAFGGELGEGRAT